MSSRLIEVWNKSNATTERKPYRFVQLSVCFFMHACSSDSTIFSGSVSLPRLTMVPIAQIPVGKSRANIEPVKAPLPLLRPCMSPNSTPPTAAKEMARKIPEEYCQLETYHIVSRHRGHLHCPVRERSGFLLCSARMMQVLTSLYTIQPSSRPKISRYIDGG